MNTRDISRVRCANGSERPLADLIKDIGAQLAKFGKEKRSDSDAYGIFCVVEHMKSDEAHVFDEAVSDYYSEIDRPKAEIIDLRKETDNSSGAVVDALLSNKYKRGAYKRYAKAHKADKKPSDAAYLFLSILLPFITSIVFGVLQSIDLFKTYLWLILLPIVLIAALLVGLILQRRNVTVKGFIGKNLFDALTREDILKMQPSDFNARTGNKIFILKNCDEDMEPIVNCLVKRFIGIAPFSECAFIFAQEDMVSGESLARLIDESKVKYKYRGKDYDYRLIPLSINEKKRLYAESRCSKHLPISYLSDNIGRDFIYDWISAPVTQKAYEEKVNGMIDWVRTEFGNCDLDNDTLRSVISYMASVIDLMILSPDMRKFNFSSFLLHSKSKDKKSNLDILSAHFCAPPEQLKSILIRMWGRYYSAGAELLYIGTYERSRAYLVGEQDATALAICTVFNYINGIDNAVRRCKEYSAISFSIMSTLNHALSALNGGEPLDRLSDEACRFIIDDYLDILSQALRHNLQNGYYVNNHDILVITLQLFEHFKDVGDYSAALYAYYSDEWVERAFMQNAIVSPNVFSDDLSAQQMYIRYLRDRLFADGKALQILPAPSFFEFFADDKRGADEYYSLLIALNMQDAINFYRSLYSFVDGRISNGDRIYDLIVRDPSDTHDPQSLLDLISHIGSVLNIGNSEKSCVLGGKLSNIETLCCGVMDCDLITLLHEIYAYIEDNELLYDSKRAYLDKAYAALSDLLKISGCIDRLNSQRSDDHGKAILPAALDDDFKELQFFIQATPSTKLIGAINEATSNITMGEPSLLAAKFLLTYINNFALQFMRPKVLAFLTDRTERLTLSIPADADRTLIDVALTKINNWKTIFGERLNDVIDIGGALESFNKNEADKLFIDVVIDKKKLIIDKDDADKIKELLNMLKSCSPDICALIFRELTDIEENEFLLSHTAELLSNIAESSYLFRYTLLGRSIERLADPEDRYRVLCAVVDAKPYMFAYSVNSLRYWFAFYKTHKDAILDIMSEDEYDECIADMDMRYVDISKVEINRELNNLRSDGISYLMQYMRTILDLLSDLSLVIAPDDASDSPVIASGNGYYVSKRYSDKVHSTLQAEPMLIDGFIAIFATPSIWRGIISEPERQAHIKLLKELELSFNN